VVLDCAAKGWPLATTVLGQKGEPRQGQPIVTELNLGSGPVRDCTVSQ
jgi:hypothetical protein